MVNQLEQEACPVQVVERKTLLQALALFNPDGSKRNSLFDAVIATRAKQVEADAIFSFDQWYKKVGFPLASAFVEEKQAA